MIGDDRAVGLLADLLVLIMLRSKTACPVIDGDLVDMTNRFGAMLSGDISLSVASGGSRWCRE